MEQSNYHKILGGSVESRRKNTSLPIVEKNSSPDGVAEDIVNQGGRYKQK